MSACRLIVALALCGCGGCDSPPQMPPIVVGDPDSRPKDDQPDGDIDARPIWEDGLLTPPGYAEPIWETVLPLTADTLQEFYIDGAVALPTGIVAIIPPDLFLIDKADGHVIAQGAMPEEPDFGQPARPLAMLARASGDLAILARFDHQQLIVLQYGKEDLVQQGTTVVLEENAPTGVMAEVNGKLVVYTGAFGEELRHLHIIETEDTGARVETTVVPDIVDQFWEHGFATPEGEMVFCSITRDESDESTYAEIMLIDPATAAFEKMRISEQPALSGPFCRLFAGQDSLMAVWRPDMHGGTAHWTQISSDGEQVLTDNVIPLWPLGDAVTFFKGQFAVLTGGSVDGYELRTLSPSTGAVTGPYRLRLQVGGRASDYHQAIATDGQHLYTVIAPFRGGGAQHRIQKLAPLPE